MRWLRVIVDQQFVSAGCGFMQKGHELCEYEGMNAIGPSECRFIAIGLKSGTKGGSAGNRAPMSRRMAAALEFAAGQVVQDDHDARLRAGNWVWIRVEVVTIDRAVDHPGPIQPVVPSAAMKVWVCQWLNGA